MKILFFSKTITALALVMTGSFAMAHGDGESRITIEPEGQTAYNAGIIQYSFQLFDDQTQKTLGDKDLTKTHTKVLHLIVYDSSRNQFNHVHPEFNGKIWSVELNLTTNGTYFIWAQGQLLDGTSFSSFVKGQVANGRPELPAVPLTEQRKATDQMTTVQLDKVQLEAGRMTMIKYKVTREDGLPVQITPYLGALAHIIAVAPDGDELIHVHPMAGSSDDSGMIHTTFPTEGDYRIWIQLIDRGVLKTIPLSVVVSK